MLSDELYVWIYLRSALTPDTQPQLLPSLCGKLELIQGRKCLFSYAPEWLAHQNAFALSPDLPLNAGNFNPPTGLDLAPIFEDAGPDRWGRQVVHKIFQLPRRSPIDYLAVAGEDRIGALGFSTSPNSYTPAKEQVFHSIDLADLLVAAQAIERHLPIDEQMRRFLRPGSSAGGARPKAIIQAEGRRWIAKFPAEDDIADICAIEHASLGLAQACGIWVPASRLVTVRRKNILLVERFDRDAKGARHHFASARTLLISQGLDINDIAYADLADIARKFSSTPMEDCQQIFRRMVFNVLMENTDDHEKNHGFLFDQNCWQLAPAYDLQPQLQGIHYQSLRVGKLGYEPSIANILSNFSNCERFMLTANEAVNEVNQMLEVLTHWPTHFANAGVCEDDIAVCQRYILLDNNKKNKQQ